MIGQCTDTNFAEICEIINDAAKVYKGAIPEDRYHTPYMTEAELRNEIDSGVRFWGYRLDNRIVGVMGIQDAKDVTLIRHAYILPECQRGGVGGMLLSHLRTLANRPILIGTWAAAVWAIRFYEKHGFVLTTEEEKNRLLSVYWDIPDRQIETSVVLRDAAAG